MLLEFLFFTIIVILLTLVNKHTKYFSLRYPTIPGFYFIFFVLMTTTILQPNEIIKYKNAPGYENFLLGIFLHVVFYLFGILIASKGPMRSEIIVNKIKLIQISKFEVKIFNITLFLAIGLFIHALLVMKNIPIIEIIRAGSDEALATEATINKESLYKESIGINNYIWNLNRQIFFPLIVVYMFSKYFKTRTKKDLYKFLIILVLGVLNNAISGSLAPVALIFFMLGISFIYLSNKIKIKHYLIIIFTSLVFPIFVDYSASNRSLLDSAQLTFEKTLFRFSGETFKRSLDYFNVYGINQPFLGGRSHKIFTYFSGEEFFNVSNYIFVQNLPVRKLGYASTGHQNAHFICYIYADFGFIGIIISSFIIGLLLSKFQILSTKYMNNGIAFPAYVILVTLFWKLMGVHPFTILFSHGALLLVFLIMYVSNKTSKLR